MNHVQSVQSFVQNDMQGVCQAHDRYHIERVCTIATHITQSYKEADIIVVQYGALLHEYFDDKFFEEHEIAGRKNILEEFLSSLKITESQQENILFIAKNVGYGKSKARDPELLLPIEFKIVEDTDRLEAVGAIAIARCFAYNSIYKNFLKNETVNSNFHSNFSKYKLHFLRLLLHFPLFHSSLPCPSPPSLHKKPHCPSK